MFGNKVEILILKRQTTSASETVYKTIKKFNIKNQIIVKDCDNSFEIDSKFNIYRKNFIVFVDISKNPEISNVHQKSFIDLNNKKQIINIEEKKLFQIKYVSVYIRFILQRILKKIIKVVEIKSRDPKYLLV